MKLSVLPQFAAALIAARFIPTDDGCHVDIGTLRLGADGDLELLEWAPELPDDQRETFVNAGKVSEGLTLAGGGFRAPSPHELVSIVDYTKEYPASGLPGIKSDWYWTNQVDPSSPSGNALYVALNGGHVGWSNQNDSGRVRAVRRVRASQYLTLGL